MLWGGEGRGGGRCLIEGGSYFNFICFGGGLIRSGSLIERGIQIKEVEYTQHFIREKWVCVGGGWVGFKHYFVDGDKILFLKYT